MKLLIVEDNAPMRQVTRRMVADLAECISEASDGDEVLRIYAEERPDWVLMDIEMARMNGIAATRQLLEAFPEARVVIVTNYNDEPLREAARRAGACGYVLKENLIDVRRLLQSAS
ncbi:MAG: response regulator transcription factor [Acidobacteria bacterium]|nr:response regulator transcription factor [Acidobacteriota bacterium]MCW5970347.1 response regulator transcription factor [Blastocatellales bacterium]